MKPSGGVTLPAGGRLLLRTGVSLGLLATLVIVLDWGQVVVRLRDLRPGWIILAGVVSTLQVALLAWRWRYTSGRLGVPIPYGRALREYYLAIFLNQVLPGGVLGDVSRAWRHASLPSSRAEEPELVASRDAGAAVRGVVLERASVQVVMIFVALLSLLSIASAHLGGREAGWTVAATASFLVLGGLLLSSTLGASRTSGKGGRQGGPRTLSGGAGTRVPRDSLLNRIRTDVRAAFLSEGALFVQLATGALVAGSYIAVYLLAARAVGIETPVLLLLPLVAPVLISMLIPITIAGWGLREGAAAALWGLVGLSAADGVAISVAYGLLILLFSLPGALIVLSLVVGSSPFGGLPDRHRGGRREPAHRP